MNTATDPAGALRTPLCALLGIRYPLIQAPMAGGWTTPALVAEVSTAGGLGMLPAARVTPDELRAAIHAVRARTDRPFGVNFQLAGLEPGNHDVAAVQRFLDRFRRELGLPPGSPDLAPPPSALPEQLRIVAEERVPVVSFALGDPGALVARVQDAGARALVMVTTVAEARRAAELGADAVIAQGAEAGGHRSTFAIAPGDEPPLVGALALVPQVADAVAAPVIAAGGIMDGRGVVAALALGAAGVQLGTRFLLARESGATPAYRRRLLAATEADTVVTRAFTGRPARGLRNRLTEEHRGAGAEPLAWPLQGLAAADILREGLARDDADLFPLLAGQGLRLQRGEQGAAEIVEELVRGATDVLTRLGACAG